MTGYLGQCRLVVMRLVTKIIILSLGLTACASNTVAPGVIEFTKTPCDQMVQDYKRELFRRRSTIYYFDKGEVVNPTYGRIYNQLYVWRAKGYRVKAKLWPGWSECGLPAARKR